MKFILDVNFQVHNADIREIIKGLQGILDKKGTDILQPYAGKQGERKYMKCGYELASYTVEGETVRIIFYNIDSQ